MKNISESTIISKALDQGLDLREFSSELNKNLEKKEKESIEKRRKGMFLPFSKIRKEQKLSLIHSKIIKS